jgi:hypothetical protein
MITSSPLLSRRESSVRLNHSLTADRFDCKSGRQERTSRLQFGWRRRKSEAGFNMEIQAKFDYRRG